MRNLFLIILLIVIASCKKSNDSTVAYATTSGYIYTIAGNGTQGYSGDGGNALAAKLSPTGVAVDAAGNVYITDYTANYIRKIDPTGVISTIAGQGLSGNGGDGGPAVSARLNQPYQVAADGFGNIYIADQFNFKVRKINSAGIITTFAGNGQSGTNGDGGPATMASLFRPTWIAADGAGNVYICDPSANRIRKVNAAGIINTIAGGGISGHSGDGGPATIARFSNVQGIAVDGKGNLYIADYGNQCVRVVDSLGIIRNFAGTGSQGFGGDGGPALNALLNNPTSLAADGAGNVYIGDVYNQVIRKVNSNGIISTIAGNSAAGYAGDGGPATNAKLNYTTGIAVDAAGNLYIADNGNYRIRKVNK